MRALTIGGTGFLGRKVIDWLLNDGHSVTSFHRRPWPPPDPLLEFVEERIGEYTDLPSLARELSCDVVIDMVCSNGHEFRSLVRAFDGYTSRIVVLSSADVYRAYEIMKDSSGGAVQPTPIAEDGELRLSRYPYRQDGQIYLYYDKLLMEEAAWELSALPTAVLRLPMVYGPGHPHCPFRWYIDQMRRGEHQIPFDAAAYAWKGCWGYVDNAAAAIVATAVTKFEGQRAYNVSDTWTPTHYAFLVALGEAIGWRGELLALDRQKLPLEALPVLNPTQHWDLDTARIRSELKFHEPVLPTEALARTAAAERDVVNR